MGEFTPVDVRGLRGRRGALACAAAAKNQSAIGRPRLAGVRGIPGHVGLEGAGGGLRRWAEAVEATLVERRLAGCVPRSRPRLGVRRRGAPRSQYHVSEVKGMVHPFTDCVWARGARRNSWQQSARWGPVLRGDLDRSLDVLAGTPVGGPPASTRAPSSVRADLPQDCLTHFRCCTPNCCTTDPIVVTRRSCAPRARPPASQAPGGDHPASGSAAVLHPYPTRVLSADSVDEHIERPAMRHTTSHACRHPLPRPLAAVSLQHICTHKTEKILARQAADSRARASCVRARAQPGTTHHAEADRGGSLTRAQACGNAGKGGQGGTRAPDWHQLPRGRHRCVARHPVET